MPIGKTRGESRTIAFMEKRAHILVVDDEQAIADLVVNLLAAEGMDDNVQSLAHFHSSIA